jgi:transcriptional regulator with XRE-family HTH domain
MFPNDKTDLKRARPGAALRALRVSKGWTLTDVSQKTGFSVPTLSKIENDRVSLSYDKLARLSDGLQVDIGLLFANDQAANPPAEAPGGRRSVTRSGEGQVIKSDAYTHVYPASELLNKKFVPMLVEHHSRQLSEFGDLIRHPGEEFTFVLTGAIELHTDIYAPLRLEEGDSIYFDSSMGHAYLAAADGPCRTLSICTGDRANAAGFPLLAHLAPHGDAFDLEGPKVVKVRRKGIA